MVGDATVLAGARLGLEPVHQVGRVVEPHPGAAAHAGAPDRDSEVSLAGAGADGKDDLRGRVEAA